jgi:uncharacterized protein YoxC
MAEKLSVEIALEGGKEIERQLADIGEAGTKAFNDIVKASEQVGGFRNIKPEEVTAKLNAMGLAGTEAFGKIQTAVTAASRLEGVASGVKGIEDAFAGLGGAVTKFGDSMTRSLGPVGALLRALGPVGTAAGLLGAAFVKSTFDAVNAINELSAAAMTLNVPIEQLDKLRQGFEAAGISAKAITSGIEQAQKDVDKFQVDRVKKNLKDLQEGTTRGFGGAATRQIEELQAAAEKTTQAGVEARKALEKLGLPIPGVSLKDMRELGIEPARLKTLGFDFKFDDTAVTRMQKAVDVLRTMPDSAERSTLALQQLGQEMGTKLVGAMRTGSLAVDTFRADLAQPLQTQSLQQQTLEAAKFEQSLNRLSSEWTRFNSLTLSPALRGIFDFGSKEIQKTQKDLIGLGRELTLLGKAAALVWNDPMAALRALGAGIAQVGTSIANSPVGKAVGGAWQWIVDKFNEAVSWVGTKLQEARAVVAAWVAEAPGNAWQWIKDKFNEAVDWIGTKLEEGRAAIAQWIADAPGNAWQWIVDTFNETVDWIGTKLEEGRAAIAQWVADAPGNAWQWIKDTWNDITSFVSQKIDDLKNKIRELLGLQSSVSGGSSGKGATTQGAFAGGGLLGGRGSGTSDSNLAWVSRGEYIVPAHVVRQPGMLAFLEALRRSGGRLSAFKTGGPVSAPDTPFGNIGPILNGLISTVEALSKDIKNLAKDQSDLSRDIGDLKNSVDQHISKIDTVFKDVIGNLSQMVERLIGMISSTATATATAIAGISSNIGELKETMDKAAAKPEAGKKDIFVPGSGWFSRDELKGKVFSRASGGLLGGRGTGTSDSNLAWVSRGEHIMPARAVSQPGVLAFLEALRRSGGSLRDVLDGMGRFALGGSVGPRPLSIPAFAGGGGMSNVTIQFPGLPEITGLRASSGVVDELRKAAALAQVRSGGRKPSRYS